MTEANGAGPVSVPKKDYPRRFSWPMRIFLFILVFDIVFRSLSVLAPVSEWQSELEVETFPGRLPTRAELGKLTEEKPAPERLFLVTRRFLESVDDVWIYLSPSPSAKSRAKITNWQQAGKWAFCWLETRCEFFEALTGIDECWPMFSPNVSHRKWVIRSRLVYEDGSEKIVRQKADPEDLTRYAHWNQEKVLDYELRAGNHWSNSQGYCNLLSHRHSLNENGSPLAKIYLFWVRYDFPPPDYIPGDYMKGFVGLQKLPEPRAKVDAKAFLAEQTERGNDPSLAKDPVYEYDVKAGTGHELSRK